MRVAGEGLDKSRIRDERSYPREMFVEESGDIVGRGFEGLKVV